MVIATIVAVPTATAAQGAESESTIQGGKPQHVDPSRYDYVPEGPALERASGDQG